MHDLDKDCDNCAHHDLTYTQEPCTSCIALPGFSKWEPQPPICTPAERALLDALRAIVTDEDADVSGNDVYAEIATFYCNPEWAQSAINTLEDMLIVEEADPDEFEED